MVLIYGGVTAEPVEGACDSDPGRSPLGSLTASSLVWRLECTWQAEEVIKGWRKEARTNFFFKGRSIVEDRDVMVADRMCYVLYVIMPAGSEDTPRPRAPAIRHSPHHHSLPQFTSRAGWHGAGYPGNRALVWRRYPALGLSSPLGRSGPVWAPPPRCATSASSDSGRPAAARPDAG